MSRLLISRVYVIVSPSARPPLTSFLSYHETILR
ncbi:hypothetical protein SSM1_082 [Synechococcus phage S-SM1]|uniref:Uncharacterized protein n=1 Tax=Synechococcus phage S-SM1 TaxID=444859 RepID=E3SI89_9CAUD|nr:hypothetical protein SSM1_082 [Synechococcus phage S-SM1]ADO97268.1 hypothetical protein SSM1_082 [Synechococcus phage S-SM1]